MSGPKFTTTRYLTANHYAAKALCIYASHLDNVTYQPDESIGVIVTSDYRDLEMYLLYAAWRWQARKIKGPPYENTKEYSDAFLYATNARHYKEARDDLVRLLDRGQGILFRSLTKDQKQKIDIEMEYIETHGCLSNVISLYKQNINF